MRERNQRPGALVGTALEGAYELTRLIGEGGMGAVYEGVQTSLNRRVAVKVMARDLAGNTEALARFRREVHITTRLAHPHIVQVLDVGTTREGLPFLVMEFLDGEDLERRLKRVRRMPLVAVLRVVGQAASALAATHRKGIVHRDLKPANVFLLDAEGVSDFVKVVDFGISKTQAAGAALTHGSVMLGTPKYMAPEQVVGRSRKVDHRADQWALGCIAWEALAGRAPFAGKDVAMILHQVVYGEPPPLADHAADVPAAIEPVLRRAMAKRPGDRFGDVVAFSRALMTAAGLPVGDERPEATERAPARPAARASFTRAAERVRAATQWLSRVELPRRARRRKGVVEYTRVLGRRALEQLAPRRRKRSRARLLWLCAAGVGATLAVSAVLLARAGVPLPGATFLGRMAAPAAAIAR